MACAVDDFRPRSLVRLYRQWAFPSARAANAVKHQHGMASRLLALPFHQVAQFSAKTKTDPRIIGSGGLVEFDAPVSLSVVTFFVLAVALFSGAEPVVFIVAISYCVVFPYGMKIDRREILESTNESMVAIAGITSVFGVVAPASLYLFFGHLGLACSLGVLLIPFEVAFAGRIVRPWREVRLARGLRAKSQRAPGGIVVVVSGSSRTSLVESIARHLELNHEIVEGCSSGRWTAAAFAMITTSAPVVVALSPDEAKNLVKTPPESIGMLVLGWMDEQDREAVGGILLSLASTGEFRGQIVALNEGTEDATQRRDIENLGLRWLSVGAGGGSDLLISGHDDHWKLEHHGSFLGTVVPEDGWAPEEVALVAGAVLTYERDELNTVHGGEFPFIGERWSIRTSTSGVVVMVGPIDAEPRSALVALKKFASLNPSGRKFVVTSGVADLEGEALTANYDFGARVAQMGGELIVVGRCNLQSLCNGYGHLARRFDRTNEAVTWASKNLNAGDAVLYLGRQRSNRP